MPDAANVLPLTYAYEGKTFLESENGKLFRVMNVTSAFLLEACAFLLVTLGALSSGSVSAALEIHRATGRGLIEFRGGATKGSLGRRNFVAKLPRNCARVHRIYARIRWSLSECFAVGQD
jgi:hypothetical protein